MNEFAFLLKLGPKTEAEYQEQVKLARLHRSLKAPDPVEPECPTCGGRASSDCPTCDGRGSLDEEAAWELPRW